MIESTIEKIKGFLLNPVEAFQQSKADEPQTVFTYFVVLLLINSILSAVIAAIGMETMIAGMLPGAGGIIGIFIAALIGSFILTLIFAAWLHLLVYILGGRKGIMQTIKVVFYASTPRLLLGWIPFIGIIFALWSLILKVIGIRELQELSTAKAVIVVVIAVLIPLILLILVAAYFMVADMTMTTVP